MPQSGTECIPHNHGGEETGEEVVSKANQWLLEARQYGYIPAPPKPYTSSLKVEDTGISSSGAGTTRRGGRKRSHWKHIHDDVSSYIDERSSPE